LWRITPRRVIIATGSAERAFLFADNDRPGLMMSMAARGYLSRFGVVPGRKGIVFTNNDDAYLTAVALHKAGAEIVRIVDTRPHPEGMAAGMAMGAGVHLSFGSAISGIETDKSGRMISGVRIIPTLRAAARGSAPERVACDFVCMSGGFEPVVPELGSAFLDAVARAPGSGEAQTEQPGDAPRILAVGAANGTLALADIIAEASEAGMAAAQERPPTQSEEGKPPGGPAENSADGRLAPAGWTIRLPGGVGERDHHFVDLRADVTVADIEVAVREGYRSPALLRHYTGLDAPDGTLRAGNPKALAVLAAFTGTSPGRSPDDRPTYGPAISFGALAGIDASHAREDTAAALRQMPLAEQHRKDGAILSAIAGWEIPSSYPLSGETQAAASWREAAAARASAGMTDLSARGKFDFSGPGSARMLSLLTENDAGTLAVGDCMSSPMFDDHGRLVDLMLAARLTEGRFTLLTGAHSAALAWRRIRALMRDGGRALRVLACPVSEQWAQFAIAGPNARDVLRWLPIKGMEWDGEAFPPNSVRQGEFGGYPLRIFRTLETGELEYEIAIGARHAGNLWRSICDAGKKFELTLLGMAGRDLMLLEVGRVRGAIGSGRQDVVGLLSDDRQKILPPGAQIVLDDAVGQSAVIAHVAASALSPALGRSIALAAITDGRALIGRPVRVVTADDGQAMAEIVDPVFLAADNPAPESVTDESGPGGGEGDDERPRSRPGRRGRSGCLDSASRLFEHYRYHRPGHDRPANRRAGDGSGGSGVGGAGGGVAGRRASQQLERLSDHPRARAGTLGDFLPGE
ncbi:MAG TPA: glycine cleavage T C-terminal barrel domain-containing protein, partial [Hyphomicrobiales bacterium]|nr:glycine cleavage T C-terminal barrel domain-containing protein [Hyphomicrobiales bacterium]